MTAQAQKDIGTQDGSPAWPRFVGNNQKALLVLLCLHSNVHFTADSRDLKTQ